MDHLVSEEDIEDMRQEAISNLAESEHDDVIIANYDYPAQVPSRDLLSILDELLRYRRQK